MNRRPLLLIDCAAVGAILSIFWYAITGLPWWAPVEDGSGGMGRGMALVLLHLLPLLIAGMRRL